MSDLTCFKWFRRHKPWKICQFHLFVKAIIRKIIPPINSPNPSNKQTVLSGCPMFVVQANSSKSKPKMIAPIENSILFFRVKVLWCCFQFYVFIFRNNSQCPDSYNIKFLFFKIEI